MSSDSSQGANHVAREVCAGYGELAPVEMPVIDLLTPLGEAGGRHYELTQAP